MPPSFESGKVSASATKKRARSGGFMQLCFGVSMGLSPSERQEGMPEDGVKPSTKGPDRRRLFTRIIA